jgi:cation diffusion facilitator CzcD-associated flavoprotein CzcO
MGLESVAEPQIEHFDVLIMGAGLSGIDAAHHLQKFCPWKTYVILEQREHIGGTWDLFRYPGIRSDSDMLTMGYSFRPWTHPKSISPGEDIREYITATAREEGIERHIRFRHTIKRASWSTSDARWTVEAVTSDAAGHEQTVHITCNFLFSCAGYYRYSAGYLPEFPGRERFRGTIVHPQAWPQNGALNYAGKKVVVIGSGATAVTLVPAMSKTAAHVTMLQRSPTYIISMPEKDRIANFLRRIMPSMWAYRLSRWKNVGFQAYIYRFSQWFPQHIKRQIINRAGRLLREDFDLAQLTPSYNPWVQRMCLVPDADMFEAINDGKASIVTDQIETFTERGIQLKSGKELEADIVVTATGLVMQACGGVELEVDGRRVDLANVLAYKGVMMSDVPNFASVFGYINASWTLKADIICRYVCRLLNTMDRRGMRQVTPRPRGERAAAPFVENFTPGYINRALASWPKQGSKRPWRVHQNYFRDFINLRILRVDEEGLEFTNPVRALAEKEKKLIATSS